MKVQVVDLRNTTEFMMAMWKERSHVFVVTIENNLDKISKRNK